MTDKALRREFNRDLAEMLLRDIQFQTSNYFYFLGGVTPWAGVGTDFTLDNPPTEGSLTFDSCETNRYHRSEMVFAKKITPNDVSLVTDRYDWIPDTVYEQWDHTLDMSGKNFFIMTDDHNVYKCLYNSEGSISTIKPNFRGLEPVKLADGYTWKYMYNISPFRFNRFRANEYIPVQKSMSESFYNNGAVGNITIVNEGQNYISNQQTTIEVNEINKTTGTGAKGRALVLPDSGGRIEAVELSDIDDPTLSGGTDYTKGAKAVLTLSNGFGFVGEVIYNGSGVITNVNVIEPGIGYTDGDIVTFELGGASFFPVVSRDTGSILDVIILEPGIGYNAPPVLTVESVSTGTGIYGNQDAVLEVVIYDGSVRHVNIIDPGVDYPVDTDTTITTTGDGVDASYFPVVLNGKIVDIIVENPGAKYTEMQLIVNSSSGTGEGAVLVPIITPSDYLTDQSVIEQLPSKGIYGSKVIYSGRDYPSNTVVTVNGNGEGCTAHAIFDQNAGIAQIIIDNPGEGYTWAEFEIIHASNKEEDKFIGYPTLPPEGGHGRDAPAELLASTVGIITPLRSELEIQSIIQDYRKFGIIKNPLNRISRNRYSRETAIITYATRFADTSNLIIDEVLTIDNNKFKVFDIHDDVVVDLIALDQEYLPEGTFRSEPDYLGVSREYTSVELINSTDFDKFSGTLLYVSLEIPFTFSVDQSLTIKTYIRF